MAMPPPSSTEPLKTELKVIQALREALGGLGGPELTEQQRKSIVKIAQGVVSEVYEKCPAASFAEKASSKDDDLGPVLDDDFGGDMGLDLFGGGMGGDLGMGIDMGASMGAASSSSSSTGAARPGGRGFTKGQLLTASGPQMNLGNTKGAENAPHFEITGSMFTYNIGEELLQFLVRDFRVNTGTGEESMGYESEEMSWDDSDSDEDDLAPPKKKPKSGAKGKAQGKAKGKAKAKAKQRANSPKQEPKKEALMHFYIRRDPNL